MSITIIGTGNMAKGIGARLLHGGHDVTFHAQDATKGAQLAQALQPEAASAHAKAAELGSATGEIVVLAVPYDAVADIAAQYDGFAGKVVVDITNPVDFSTFQLIPQPGTSGAEAIAAQLPNATVVKAFNTVFAGTLSAGAVEGTQLDVFVAGDDAAAKQQVSKLIDSSDMRAIDAGPLAHARHLEGLALIHMSGQDQLKTNWMSTIKILG